MRYPGVRIIKMFLMMHWVKVVIVLAVGGIIFMAVWALSQLESFYRNIQIAQIPIWILMGCINAVVFVFLYMSVFRGGFSKMDNKKVTAKDVNICFSDVIGMDEAKEEAWEVVELIKDHTKLQKIGGKILRGILMIGPPGCK